MRFSIDDERRLTTCGTGHIRFWKLAATFTGLKLQGLIGKFGKAELSDIAAFVECPDGKVVSGTESGSLLLWEGNFIKCRFVRPGGELCHAGDVTYIDLDREERRIISASEDGYIRWWNFDIMDSAEVDSDMSLDFELEVLTEYYLGPGIGVKMMVDGGLVGEARTFFIVDTTGCSRTIFFHLGEEPDEVVKPGLVKRRSIRDIIVANPTKKIRKLSSVLSAMKPEYKNLSSNLFRISECATPVDGDVPTNDANVSTDIAIGEDVRAVENQNTIDMSMDEVDVEVEVEVEVGITRSSNAMSRSYDGSGSMSGRAPLLSSHSDAFNAIKPVTKELGCFHSGIITGKRILRTIYFILVSLFCSFSNLPYD